MKAVAIVIVVGLVAGPAIAGDGWPDITGTWKGEGIGVMRSGDGPVSYPDDTVRQVVTEQRGRRFAGKMHSTAGGESFAKPFVGVFVDGANFLWSEPNGVVHGRLVDPDTILSCYAHTGADPLIAACNTLTRQD